MKAITTANLNVRSSPEVSPTNKIGLLPKGVEVEVEAKTGDWGRIRISHGQTPIGVAYASLGYLDFAQPPPPVTTKRIEVGVNALVRHEDVCYPAARAGCKYFMILNNPGFASKLKREYPDATVMVRIYWDKRMPSQDEYIFRMDGCQDPNIIYTGLNEADECPQDYDGIIRRANWDVSIARRIKAINPASVYAAGTFSMGTPDFTQPAICDLIRRVYAPHYNSGLISWDHHLYSPNMAFGPAPRSISPDSLRQYGMVTGKNSNHVTWKATSVNSATWIDPIWFETRWRFLFTHCGFDPLSKSRVYCSETGVDEGGVGGFPAHGATPADIVRWAKWWAAVQTESILGAPSPVVGGAIFQVGNREDWAGYNVEYAYAALDQEVWI